MKPHRLSPHPAKAKEERRRKDSRRHDNAPVVSTEALPLTHCIRLPAKPFTLHTRMPKDYAVIYSTPPTPSCYLYERPHPTRSSDLRAQIRTTKPNATPAAPTP
jgi:hypothetical protein